ncbi:hypothetical protein pkur_cds_836 [Pandoravirus kuranda]|uniref:Uncharacterized protein n=1 Tax=Pandoravirus kuranda TaxID=3019033 RepID=A0AA95EFE5_9VIRU|nr:hypothetical protein pkur_cds_836 [Pandoravirus kuranda]
MEQGPKTESLQRQRQPMHPHAAAAQTRSERRRGSCMQRLLVGELRSYSAAFEGMAMLDTVATALIGGVINSGRAYPGAKVLSLTALDHDAYPAGSGLCTMVCVVRWCGPPGVAWVATDLDINPTRFPESDVIAEGALPDGLVVEFHRAGLLNTPRMSSEASRPLPPPPRFVIAALRPRLCATVEVAPDGSISRRPTPQADDACPDHDRVWRTPEHLVRPLTTVTRQNIAAVGRCLSGTLARDAVPASVTRAVAKAIVSTLASIKTPASTATSPADVATVRVSHTACKIASRERRRRDTQQQQLLQQRQEARPTAQKTQIARSSVTSSPALTHRACLPSPKGSPAPSSGDADGNAIRTQTLAVVATSPSIVTHAKCAAADCAAASKAATGKIVRVECTAGCRVTFHRPCWRAMAIGATDTRPCMTPDCWGLWARVTSSTRRAVDGAETPPYVEWSRTPRRSPASVGVAGSLSGDQSTAAHKPCPPKATSPSPALPCAAPAGPIRSAKADDKTTGGAGDVSDGYVGRIRRRRLRQRQNGPPHKRLDSVKTLARAADEAPSIVVAGGATVESAMAEQEMTRARRRLAIVPVVRGGAALGQMVLKTKKARATTTRPAKGQCARGNHTPSPEPTTSIRATEAIGTEETRKPETAPTDLNGAWAAFFEWDSVPPSLVPEAPAARPSTEGLWTPPPLLVMAGGGTALCCPAAVWSCFCQRALAA